MTVLVFIENHHETVNVCDSFGSDREPSPNCDLYSVMMLVDENRKCPGDKLCLGIC